MSVTKVDIIERIYKEAGISKGESAKLVDLVFETIKATLSKGESIKISGLGSFSINDKSSRIGRNPQTGESMEITGRRVLTFKASNILKEDITNRYSHRINDDGKEDITIPAKPGKLRALNNFAVSEEN